MTRHLFYFLTALKGMWDLSSLTRNQTRAPCIGRWSLNQWTARGVPPSPFRHAVSSLGPTLGRSPTSAEPQVSVTQDGIWKECINRNGARGYHSKWRESDRERWIPYETAYTCNLKHDTNEPFHETETQSQTQKPDRWLPNGRGLEGGWNGRLGLAEVSFFM